MGGTFKVFNDLSSAKIIAVDIETCDPSITAGLGAGELRDGFICGISLATDDGFAEYFPIKHAEGENLDIRTVYAYLKEQLNRPHQIKLGHNIMYDARYLKEAGVDITGKMYDTEIAEGLLDENKGSEGYSLESVATKHTGSGKESEYLYAYLSAKFGGKPTRKAQAKNIWRAPGAIVRAYAISDVVQPINVFKEQRILLESQGLLELFELECSLLPLLMAMRRRGVKIDTGRVEILKHQFKQDIDLCEKEVYKLFGREFNLRSSKQLGEVFESLGVTGKKTATGKLSTAKAALALFEHPAAKRLLELREMNTLLSTFLTGYCTEHLINGRLHCQLHPLKSDQGGTVTGRFSCSDPNLQNIPKKRSQVVRSLFLPDNNDLWFSDDLSQIEYRLLVHYATGASAEEARQAYISNPDTDYHAYVKDLIVQKTQREISRSSVKAINFGLMYTKGKKSLAADLGLSLKEAEQLFEMYHSSLPYVIQTQRKFASRANQRGYIHTILKRRRRFDLWEPVAYDPDSPRKPPLPHAEALEKYGAIKRAKTKDALNAGLQGGCADLMKLSMLKIWESGICDVLGAPSITVHDELNWSVPQTKIALEAHQAAVDIMKNCYKLKVPLLVSSKSGKNWGELI